MTYLAWTAPLGLLVALPATRSTLVSVMAVELAR